MDILYPLGTGSQWYNYEILYSLRSYVKHYRNLDRVFICGEDPRFFKDVTIIPKKDVSHTQKNIWDKVYEACESDISDPFLFTNDDHFILKDFEEYPYYFDGQIREKRWLRELHRNPYFKIVARTLTLLDEMGLPSVFYDGHYPMVIHKDRFIRLYDHIEQFIRTGGVIMKSMYCNAYNVGGEYMEDLKLKSKYNQGQIQAFIKNRQVFSVGDPCCSQALKNVLDNLYPEKYAKFECKE